MWATTSTRRMPTVDCLSNGYRLKYCQSSYRTNDIFFVSIPDSRLSLYR